MGIARLFSIDTDGFTSIKGKYASAEALAQALPSEESALTGMSEGSLIKDFGLWSSKRQQVVEIANGHLLQTACRSWVARQPNTPKTTLSTLSKDHDHRVRSAVANNRSTPSSILEELAVDPHGDVRQEVAGNEKTPEATVITLAKDPDWLVRRMIPRNEKVPISILEELATDPDLEVRAWVARSAKTPASILTELASDRESYVRTAAKANPNYDPSLPMPRKP